MHMGHEKCIQNLSQKTSIRSRWICSMHGEVRKAYKILRTDYLEDLEMDERFILQQHPKK
jgi:hypothetical protein